MFFNFIKYSFNKWNFGRFVLAFGFVLVLLLFYCFQGFQRFISSVFLSVGWCFYVRIFFFCLVLRILCLEFRDEVLNGDRFYGGSWDRYDFAWLVGICQRFVEVVGDVTGMFFVSNLVSISFVQCWVRFWIVEFYINIYLQLFLEISWDSK